VPGIYFLTEALQPLSIGSILKESVLLIEEESEAYRRYVMCARTQSSKALWNQDPNPEN
jgi:hypothetical protein